jgi:DNA-binding transcriptional LysR family regulator
MDRMTRLTVFARVAELESFTGAAKSLGYPKASISTAVAQLEAHVGARLLQRTTRKVSLTHDGRMFYERCKDLLADVEDLEALFQRSEGLSGRLRVDLPSRLARFRVIPALPEFLAQHPALELEVGTTDRAVDLVREGYDCVVRVGDPGDNSLISRRLGELRLMNAASPRYLAQHGTPKRLADLNKHHQVHWVAAFGQKPSGWEYFHHGEWKELPMSGRLTVNNAEAYVAAAVAGLGLIQVPMQSLEEELRSGQLVEVLPQHRAASMPVSILYPNRRQLSRRARVFIDWLAERLS